MLTQILNKISSFHSLSDDSPTHHQLIRCMEASGFNYSPRVWQSRFSERNLNFAADACKYLEFKHYLAQLVSYYCPEVMPETYILDNSSWSIVLSEIANKYYYQHALVDPDCVPNLAWILKPALLNNGHHIKIFNRLSQIEDHFLTPNHVGGPHVLQRYITNPDLYENHKYSLRFFVVITQEAGAFLYGHGYSNVAL
jgi:tubulin--tyrosine ligase